MRTRHTVKIGSRLPSSGAGGISWGKIAIAGSYSIPWLSRKSFRGSTPTSKQRMMMIRGWSSIGGIFGEGIARSECE